MALSHDGSFGTALTHAHNLQVKILDFALVQFVRQRTQIVY